MVLQKSEKPLMKLTSKNSFHQKFKVSGRFLEIICMLSKAKVENT